MFCPLLSNILIFETFSITWFIVFVIVSFLLTFSVEKSSNFFSIVCFVAMFLFSYFSNPSLMSYFSDSGLIGTIVFFSSYVIIGSVFSCFKWYLYCNQIKSEYETFRNSFMESNNIASPSDFTEQQKLKFKYSIYRDKFHWVSSYPNGIISSVNWDDEEDRKIISEIIIKLNPSVYNNYSRIIKWMSCWPWSLLWTIFDDLLCNIFSIIRNRLGKFMSRIADSVFVDINNDLNSK